MATELPHSIDALCIAVQALIDNRPMPEEWSKPDVAAPVPVAASEPMPTFDPEAVVQEIVKLVDDKIAAAFAALPPPDPPMIMAPAAVPDMQELLDRMAALEHAAAQPKEQPIPPAIAEPIAQLGDIVMVVSETTKTQTLKTANLEIRLNALEDMMAKIQAAIHEGGA